MTVVVHLLLIRAIWRIDRGLRHLALRRRGEYSSTMMIELPDADIESLHLTPEQARLELAVGLYAGREVTLGRAARIAGVTYAAFMQELGKRRICISYTERDALDDIRQLRQRSSK